MMDELVSRKVSLSNEMNFCLLFNLLKCPSKHYEKLLNNVIMRPPFRMRISKLNTHINLKA